MTAAVTRPSDTRVEMEMEGEGAASDGSHAGQSDRPGSDAGHADLDPTKRICASRARSEYGLKEDDLDALDCYMVSNPHYRCAPPMRLYLLGDVVRAAAERAARIAAVPAMRKQRAAQRSAQEKEAAARAATTVREFANAANGVAQAGSTPWPVDAWALVLQALAAHHLTDPVRGMTLPVSEVCRAALVCRDLRLASRATLQAIAADTDAVEHHMRVVSKGPDASRRMPEHLAAAIRAPTSLTLPQLKELARQLGCAVGGTKPVLVLRLLAALGLAGPNESAPAPLVWLIRAERAAGWQHHPDLPTIMDRVRQLHMFDPSQHNTHVVDTASVWWCRRFLARLLPTHEAVLELGVRYARWVAEACERVARAREEARVRQLQARQSRIGSCGHTPSPYCATKCCRNCCRGPCGYHCT